MSMIKVLSLGWRIKEIDSKDKYTGANLDIFSVASPQAPHPFASFSCPHEMSLPTANSTRHVVVLLTGKNSFKIWTDRWTDDGLRTNKRI